MCMQWLPGSLFPSPKRAWRRGYYHTQRRRYRYRQDYFCISIIPVLLACITLVFYPVLYFYLIILTCSMFLAASQSFSNGQSGLRVTTLHKERRNKKTFLHNSLHEGSTFSIHFLNHTGSTLFTLLP